MPRDAEEIMTRFVGGKYLLLHRENYLGEGVDVRPFINDLAKRLSLDEVRALLRAGDWRPRIVGIYCVLASRNMELFGDLARMWNKSGYEANRRPICLALTVLGDKRVATLLAKFLRRPLDPDLTDVYGAAVEGLRYLRPAAYAKFEPIYDAKLAKRYGPNTLAKCRESFTRALAYWSAEVIAGQEPQS